MNSIRMIFFSFSRRLFSFLNSHPSILKIKNNTQHNTLFDFKPTDVDTVNKLVSKINIKKATGVDQIGDRSIVRRSITPKVH